MNLGTFGKCVLGGSLVLSSFGICSNESFSHHVFRPGAAVLAVDLSTAALQSLTRMEHMIRCLYLQLTVGLLDIAHLFGYLSGYCSVGGWPWWYQCFSHSHRALRFTRCWYPSFDFSPVGFLWHLVCTSLLVQIWEIKSAQRKQGSFL